MSRKCKVSGQALLEELRSQQGLHEQDVETSANAIVSQVLEDVNSQLETLLACIRFEMSRKRKVSGQALLEELRSQQGLHEQDVETSANAIISHALEEKNSQPETLPIDVDDDDNSASSSSTTQSQQKKKEGHLLVKLMDTTTNEITSQKMIANEVWQMAKNVKIIVKLNSDGHGEDNGSNLLVRFLGKLAQNPTLCPIHINSWHWMPKPKKFQMWKYVEDHFLFDYAAGCKWVMSTLGERWRAYKYQLRRTYFSSTESQEELLAKPPPGVDSSVWTTFVEHYHGEKMKNTSAKNTTNRKKLKVPHTGGSMSNARKASQMVKKLGRPVCRGEVVLSNLLKRDGSYVNELGKTLADKISKNITQDQECAAITCVPSKIYAQPDDAIGKVFGGEHSGRVRGLGIGVSPSTVFGLPGHILGSVGTNTSINVVTENCNGDLRKQVEALKEKLADYEKIKEELSQTQSQLRMLYKLMQDKFGFDLHTVGQDVQQS